MISVCVKCVHVHVHVRVLDVTALCMLSNIESIKIHFWHGGSKILFEAAHALFTVQFTKTRSLLGECGMPGSKNRSQGTLMTNEK